MSAEQAETLSKAAQSRGENMMINRACEIFIDARKTLGNDLVGSSLVDLIADHSGYPLDACRELASIVVERCVCSDRLKEKYCEGVEIPSRITELARVAYGAYGASVNFTSYNGDKMPKWDQLTDHIKIGWRGSVVELLLEYQAGNGSVQDPGETIENSERHYAGKGSGISMRMIRPAGEPGQPLKMIIERSLHGREINAGVERMALTESESRDLSEYLAFNADKFWRD